MTLEYVDASGVRTVRAISPVGVIGAMSRPDLFTGTYLHARCSIAKSLRTFRFDRIEAISHPATGEVFDLPSWVSSLELGEAKPWGGDAGAAGDAEEEVPADENASVSRLRWIKVVAIASAVGYSLGRWRIIRWGLKLLGVKYCSWL